MPLLKTDFIARLEQMDIMSHRPSIGRMKGDKRSKRRGSSVEFADYRDYTPGDDPRFIDWNVYSRLGRLFVKLFVEEEDLFVFLLVDSSRSMGYGNPDKWLYARKLAAAIGVIALCGQNRVGVRLLGDNPDAVFPVSRGRPNIWRLMDFLEAAECRGETSLTAHIDRFTLSVKQSGIVVLLSDMLDPAGWERCLQQLSQRRFETSVIQVLAPQEVSPTVRGDLKLVDMENRQFTEISTSGALLALYEKNLKQFCNDIREECIRYGMPYWRVVTDQSLESVLVRDLQQIGLVK